LKKDSHISAQTSPTKPNKIKLEEIDSVVEIPSKRLKASVLETISNKPVTSHNISKTTASNNPFFLSTSTQIKKKREPIPIEV
jgi:hypothetical protein